MLVENLLGKPEPCLSNSNRQLRGDDEGVRKRRKCHGVCYYNKTVSTCILCQKPTCEKCSQDNFRVTYKLTSYMLLYFVQNILFKSKIISLCVIIAI